MSAELSDRQSKDLERAVALLEGRSLAARLTEVVGAPVEKALERLPAGAQVALAAASRKALDAALHVAIATLERGGQPGRPASTRWHTLLAATTGAAGGAFGLPALALELPLSTTLMLRSVADIARSEGADLDAPSTRLECVQVLAFGEPAGEDRGPGAETGYFAVRRALAGVVGQAARHLAAGTLEREGAPILVRLLTQVAERFSVQVSQKAAAQLVPVLGAVGGALVNTMFMGHFQDLARGHFIVRRLERELGAAVVEARYRAIADVRR